MRQKTIGILLVIAVCLALLPPVIWAEGEEEDTDGGVLAAADLITKIYSADELKAFANLVNGGEDYSGMTVTLMNDITLSGTWTPIGTAATNFAGTFDGGSHTISGLNAYDDNNGYQGLFGYIGTDGVVKNLGVVNGDVYGRNSYNGGVAGNNSGKVESCYFTGYVGSYSYHAGGVVGENSGTVTNCYSTGRVAIDSSYAGGVVGYNSGKVENCYNISDVESGNGLLGGIVGENDEGTVTNCYYLEGVADSGIGGGSGEAESKTENEFASGEVAWLLQGGQAAPTPQVWGQTVGSGYPALTNDISKQVIKVTYQSGGGDNMEYANEVPVGAGANDNNVAAVTLPEGTNEITVMVNADGSASMTVPDDSVVMSPGKCRIVVGRNDNRTTVNNDGDVTLPAGGSVRIGAAAVALPEGGTLEPDDAGDVPIPSGAIADGMTVPVEGGVIIRR